MKLIELREVRFDELDKDKISEMLGVDRKYVKKFNDGDYKGWIILHRGSLMGSLIIDTGAPYPFIVRGYPKLHYLEKKVMYFLKGGEIVFEEKLNGTNLVCVYDPNIPVECCGIRGLLIKTRMTPIAEEEWQNLLRECPHFDQLVKALRESKYQIVVELCGSRNRIDVGEGFGLYDEPIFFRVIDVIRYNTLNFLSRNEKRDFCRYYDLPIVNEELALLGASSRESLLEFAKDLEKYCEEHKLEGVVAKVMVNGDQLMAKIKPEVVKEVAIKKCGDLPKHAILKAVQKVKENVADKESEEALEFLRDELLEEFPKETIDKHWNRIVNIYRKKIAGLIIPDEVEEFLKQMPKEILMNKRAAMADLGERFGRNNASKLYNYYSEFLERLKRENGA